MGRQDAGQERLFYDFCLEEQIPAHHLLRRIDGVLDLGEIRKGLAPFYSHTGRPPIDLDFRHVLPRPARWQCRRPRSWLLRTSAKRYHPVRSRVIWGMSVQ